MRTVASALLAVVVLAVPATASHKRPVSETYEVTAPVAYPVGGTSHCSEGVEGLTKNTRPFTFPERGALTVELSGFLGDWVLELHDDKGRSLSEAAALTPTDTAPTRKLTFKKGKAKQRVSIVVCNYGGSPNASVTYTFTHG